MSTGRVDRRLDEREIERIEDKGGGRVSWSDARGRVDTLFNS